MADVDLQPLKGTRDFLAREKMLRDKIIEKLKKTFEKYGFNPLETPAIEKLEVLSAKYAGGEEILKEMYKLEDQGKRKLALRYDLTVPFARVIALQNLAMPFKRYCIDKVWRDGPIKLGRYRELYQCDCDVAGTGSTEAFTAELLAMASDFFKQLEMPLVLHINNVKILKGLLLHEKIEAEKLSAFMLSLDKLKKIGLQGVEAELLEKGFAKERIVKILSKLPIGVSEPKALRMLARIEQPMLQQGLKELKELLELLKQFNVNNYKFSPELSRGLAYYTGMVYEGFLEKSDVTSSVCAGGRYDEMIGMFKGNASIPTVGISFGLEPIFDAFQEKERAPSSCVKAMICPINMQKQGIALAQALRGGGINTHIDLSSKSISKNLDYASKQGIPFAIIVGELEVKAKKFTLKNLESGKSKTLSLKQLQNFFKKLV